MGIEIDIEKKLNTYPLTISLKSNAKRIGILGESGAGKSMTLKCIAGIEKPDRGTIRVEDITYYDSSAGLDMKCQNRNCGYMFQNYALFPTMTVYENVAMGIRKGKTESCIHDYLKRFKLDELKKFYPSQLSGGQKQRVAMARMLIGEPEIIMLDEPFSALDANLRDEMQQELLEILDNYNKTAVMVSHNRDEIYRFSDEIYVLNNGKIIEGGNKKEIFSKPKKCDTARLTGCKNIAELVKYDDHSAYVPRWNLKIKTKRIIPDCKYLGYRLHDFELAYSDNTNNADCENIINVKLKNKAELPFETNLYFETEGDFGNAIISCFVSRHEADLLNEKGMPEGLKLDEDKMIFLEE